VDRRPSLPRAKTNFVETHFFSGTLIFTCTGVSFPLVGFPVTVMTESPAGVLSPTVMDSSAFFGSLPLMLVAAGRRPLKVDVRFRTREVRGESMNHRRDEQLLTNLSIQPVTTLSSARNTLSVKINPTALQISGTPRARRASSFVPRRSVAVFTFH
jgi:hypothetical protein